MTTEIVSGLIGAVGALVLNRAADLFVPPNRVRLRVHRSMLAFSPDSHVECLIITPEIRSPRWEVEITHLWLEDAGGIKVHLVNCDLPIRLPTRSLGKSIPIRWADLPEGVRVDPYGRARALATGFWRPLRSSKWAPPAVGQSATTLTLATPIRERDSGGSQT